MRPADGERKTKARRGTKNLHRSHPAMTDRHPPNNPQAEHQVLGCMLLKLESIHEVAAEYPMAPDLFWNDLHRYIYDAIQSVGTTDLTQIVELLRNRQQLEPVGGIAFLSSLMNTVAGGGVEEVRRYAAVLARDYTRRKLLEVSAVMAIDAFESEDAAEALAKAERSVMEIGASMQSESDPTVKSLVHDAMTELGEAFDNRGIIRGLSVGFPDLDWMTHGLKSGQIVIIAARPGVGKTSLAMNIVENVAVDQKFPVGVFSLEMTGKELIHRMTCSRSKIDSNRAQSGDIQNGDLGSLTAAAGKISNAPIFICEKGGLTIFQLSARARRMHQRYKLKLLVIDYLQLMQSRIKGNRNEQITEISNGLKALAKDLRIPVIVLSQLSRDVEKSEREPRMSDLRDSGSIEQDADLVMLLSPKPIEEKSTVQVIEALIPKHRGGPVGKIKLVFTPSLTRFESCARTAEVPTGDERHWQDKG